MLPVVSSLAKVDGQWAVLGMVLGIVGMASLPMQRMVPIAHQLGGSRSHAAGIAVAAWAACTFRTKVIVRIVLVPFGLDEIFVFTAAMARHHMACLFQHSPVGSH